MSDKKDNSYIQPVKKDKSDSKPVKKLSTGKKTVISLGSVIILAGLIGGGYTIYKNNQAPAGTQTVKQSPSEQKADEFNNLFNSSAKSFHKKIYKALSDANPQPEQPIFMYENQNQAMMNAGVWKKSAVKFGKLDKYGRPTSVTAFLDSSNLVSDKDAKYPDYKTDPLGWKGNKNANKYYQKASLIDPNITKGLNIKTDSKENVWLASVMLINQSENTQPYYMLANNYIRSALAQDCRVMYHAQLIYRGDEKIPRGIAMEATSTDGRLNFNIYIANVLNGYLINYKTGELTQAFIMQNNKKVPLMYNTKQEMIFNTMVPNNVNTATLVSGAEASKANQK